jgi:hypothetical protein
VDFERRVGNHPVLRELSGRSELIASGRSGLYRSADGVAWTLAGPVGLSQAVSHDDSIYGVIGNLQDNAGAPQLQRVHDQVSTPLTGPWGAIDLLQIFVGNSQLYAYTHDAAGYALWVLDGPDTFSSIPVPTEDFLEFASSAAGVYARQGSAVARVEAGGLVAIPAPAAVKIAVSDAGVVAVYGVDDGTFYVSVSEDDFVTSEAIGDANRSLAGFVGSAEGTLFGVDFDGRVHRSVAGEGFDDVGPMPGGDRHLVALGDTLFARVGLLFGVHDELGLRTSPPLDDAVRYAAGESFRGRQIFGLTYRPEVSFDRAQLLYTDDHGDTWYAAASSPQAPIVNLCGGLTGFFIGNRLQGGKSHYSEDLMTAFTDGSVDFFNAQLEVSDDLTWPINDCHSRGNAVVLAAGENGIGGLFLQGTAGGPSWGQYTDPWNGSEPTALIGDPRNSSDVLTVYRQEGDFTAHTVVQGFPSPSYADQPSVGRSFSRVVSAVPGMLLWEDAELTSDPTGAEIVFWETSGLPASDWLHLQRGEEDGYVWVGTATGLYRSTEQVLTSLRAPAVD